jgi:hypothetical protein
VPTFLVEGYLPTATGGELETLARRAHALEAAEAIRYLGSLVLSEDEVCFHIFEAPSVAALVEASERAELGHDRVVETIWIPGAPAPKYVEPA